MFAVARSRVGRAIYASLVGLAVATNLLPRRTEAAVPIIAGGVMTGLAVRGLASGGQVLTRTLALSSGRNVPVPASAWGALPVVGTLGLMGLHGEFLRARPALAPDTTPTESRTPHQRIEGRCEFFAEVFHGGPGAFFPTPNQAAAYVWGAMARPSNQTYFGLTQVAPSFGSSCPAPTPSPDFDYTSRSACTQTGNRWGVGASELPHYCREIGRVGAHWREYVAEVTCPHGYVRQNNTCVRYVPDGIPTIVPQNGQWQRDSRDTDAPPAEVSGGHVAITGVDQHGTPVRVEVIARPDGGVQVLVGVQSGNDATMWNTIDLRPDGSASTSTETRPGTPSQSQPQPQPQPQPQQPAPQEITVETCGLPGKPPCKIDETGTPAASSDPPPQLQAAIDDLQRAIGEEHDMPGTPPVLPSLPAGRCSPIQYSLLGRSMSLDLCPYAEISRLVLGWLYAMLLGWYVWRRGHDVVIGR